MLDGHTLRDAREAMGLTQSDLASLVGVTRQSIAAYERGTGNPRLSHWLRLCDVLELDAHRTEAATPQPVRGEVAA